MNDSPSSTGPSTPTSAAAGRPASPGAGSWAAPSDLARRGKLALAVGLAGAALLVLGYFTAPEALLRAYLVGWTYWLSFALGSLALLMIYHLTTGQWGTVARPILEAAVGTLPWLALLFVPILLGTEELYEWSHGELHGHKALWFDRGFWIGRSVAYLAIWVGLGWLLRRWSRQQGASDSPRRAGELTLRMRRLAAPGLVLFGLVVTFAAIDWLMSLDPHWYSTIYGVWYFGGAGLAALGLLVVVGLFLARRPPMEGVIAKHHFHDWGKLLLAFTMLWAYFSVSQLLIIWSADIPEEVIWYQVRLTGGWQGVGLALALLHFVLPFLLLLSQDLKRQARLLSWVAGLLLVMHWVDLYWNVVPVFSPGDLAFHWLDAAAPVALGGLWLWLFARDLAARPLLPVNDPYLEEVLSDGGH